MNLIFSICQGMFEWVWGTSIWAAILALLVLGVQWMLGRRLGPRMHYALSLLVLIRLLLPPLATSSISLQKLLPHQVSLTRSIAISYHNGDETHQKVIAFGRTIPIAPLPSNPRHEAAITLGCAIWVCGVLLLGALAAWRYRQWSLRLKRAQLISDSRLLELIEDARKEMGVSRRVVALSVDHAAGPAVFGIVNVRLILPGSFLQRLDEAELRMVLLHEMSHVRRHDALFNTLLMAVHFVHWFNPLVWIALRRIRADRETICDDMVMQKTGAAQSASYGRLLLRLMEQFPVGQRFLPSNVAMAGGKNEIKRRIIMIKNHGEKRLVGGFVAIVTIVVLGYAGFTRAENSNSSSAKARMELDSSRSTTAPLADQLIGTWVLEKELGPKSRPSGVGKRLKNFTGTHWNITQADPKTGVTDFYHGGTYKLEGDKYFEHVDFANENTKGAIGHTGEFTIKIEGDTLTQTGINNPWNEVWKRVK